jgi:hypothetical protein
MLAGLSAQGAKIMKHHLMLSMAGAGLLFFSLSAGHAAAQNRDDWYHNREEFYRGNDWHMHLFDRVREDLDHAETDSFRGSDRGRIDHTKMELAEMQGKLAAHRYDQKELNDVLGSLREVVKDNRLSEPDRDMLNDDLARLRDYREHHDAWR